MEDYQKQVEVKESKAKRDHAQKENDYKATTELLKHKVENLKEELSRAFASVSLRKEQAKGIKTGRIYKLI